MGKLHFKILKQRGNARVGEITLNGITLTTPIFMPVGTKATIKGLLLDLLQNPHYVGDADIIKLILANTFHLYLRPGDTIIKEAGGLHQFEKRPGLILTDSGGFQVFSLGLKTQIGEANFAHPIQMKLSEEGVKFRSPYDGSKHMFTPESVVDIQRNLGSDIMMMLDVCSPADADKRTIAQQMHMTHRRARRAYEYFSNVYNDSRGVLFPIVQGGSHLDLRQESIDIISQYAPDGIAVGGVSVGEGTQAIQQVVEFSGAKLPENTPRYLMGIGTPEDIMHAVLHGFDMFDCVLATRLGRHGVMFGDEGVVHISNAKYKKDFSDLSTLSPGLQGFSKAYVHHLVKEGEMLGGIILSLHNILYLHHMLENRKQQLLTE